MPNVSGMRGVVTRSIEAELTRLEAINLVTEAETRAIPLNWFLDKLHRVPAVALVAAPVEEPTPVYAALAHLGEMRYTRRPYMDLNRYAGIGAGYLIVINQHTKKARLKTRQELLKNQLCKPGHPDDAYMMILNDIQHFRAALLNWLEHMAPTLYRQENRK